MVPWMIPWMIPETTLERWLGGSIRGRMLGLTGNLGGFEIDGRRRAFRPALLRRRFLVFGNVIDHRDGSLCNGANRYQNRP
jgi:hypothetical protein